MADKQQIGLSQSQVCIGGACGDGSASGDTDPRTPLRHLIFGGGSPARIVVNLCTVGDSGKAGARQMSAQPNGVWKRFLSLSSDVADTNRNRNNKAGVIRLFEARRSQVIFVCFLFPHSPSRNPSPWSRASATKPPCSPSLCGYPEAPAASLLLDSLVRQESVRGFLAAAICPPTFLHLFFPLNDPPASDL